MSIVAFADQTSTQDTNSVNLMLQLCLTFINLNNL